MHAYIAALAALIPVTEAWADDWGPEEIGGIPTHEFEGPYELVATGAPMVTCVPGGALCGGVVQGQGSACSGLDDQQWNVGGFPDGGRFVAAWMIWSHSKESASPADGVLTVALPGGDPMDLQADVNTECVDYASPIEGESADLLGIAGEEIAWATCRHDVTDRMNLHLEQGGSINGRWEAEGLDVADDREISCMGLAPTNIWHLTSSVVGSVVFVGVLAPDVATAHRKIYLYNGFRFIEGPEVFDIDIDGFLAPPEPQASVLIHILEGDGGLVGDELRFNGDPLADDCNPQNNVWNGTINVGRADGGCLGAAEGTDLDLYDVGHLIQHRDTEATLRMTMPAEQLLTNFVAIQFDSVPEFIKPSKGSDPRPNTPISLGETIRYDINVLIGGDGDASQVVITDPVPTGTRYVAGSATIDGSPVPHPAGQDVSPIAEGLPVTEILGRPLARGDRHVISFEVCTIAEPPEGQFSNVATLDAQGVDPEPTNPVIHPYSGEGAASLCDHAGGQAAGGAGGDAGEGEAGDGEAGDGEAGDGEAGDGEADDGEGGDAGGEGGEGEGEAGEAGEAGGAGGGSGICPPGTQRVADTNECVSDCRAGFHFDALSGLCVEGPAPGGDSGEAGRRRGGGCSCDAPGAATSTPWWGAGWRRR